MATVEGIQGIGTTASRPTSPVVGAEYFDTDLNQRYRWSGTLWVLAERSLGTGATDAAAGTHNHDAAYVNVTGDTMTGEMVAPDFKAAGLTGATAASRYVGATASGAPTTGTFALGDFVVDQTGKVWVCTTAGTPGTWTAAGAGGMLNPMTTAGDIILAGASGTPTRLPKGADNYVFTIDPTTHLPIWAAPTLAADTDVTISLAVNGQFLQWQSSDSKWHNHSLASADIPNNAADTTGKSGSTDALKSASTTVNVSAATAPTAGQTLTATDSTHATWQTPATPALTTKGDMIAAASGGTATRLPVGTDGQMLYSDSTQTLGVKWAAAPSGGGSGALIGTATASANDAHTNNNTWENIAGLSVTVSPTGTSQLFCTATLTQTNDSDSTNWLNNNYRFVLDGTTTSETWFDGQSGTAPFGDTAWRHLVNVHTVFSAVAAGSHTVTIQWETGSDLNVTFYQRRLTVMVGS